MTMLLYSAALTLGLILASPFWLWRMLTTQRYREGLLQRLGRVPATLADDTRRTIWLHAVSVGETLAATRLVSELEAALGPEYRIVISTTTRTGQALARQRFGADRVFYMSLDFAFAVRSYLRVLKPAALILMESELWPRMLYECYKSNIPVAVANARVSDRSFARALKVRRLWRHLLRLPTLWLAQSEEDARRLLTLGARPETLHTTGNLKYDIPAPRDSWIAELIGKAADGRPIIVAGSTVKADRAYEDLMILEAWRSMVVAGKNALVVIAPRHPECFEEVYARAHEYRAFTASSMMQGSRSATAFAEPFGEDNGLPVEVVILDTIGDLASVYAIADIAFVGGSLVPRGGHNPLEPAQFGVPVIMGPSFENFRDIVSKMQTADAIRIVPDEEALEVAFIDLLTHPEGKALGQRGRAVYEAQQGATARTVKALLATIPGAHL